MKRLLSIFGISIVFFSFCASCYTAEKNWTVMIYLAADNDLESYAITDFLEISKIGSDDKVNLLVQFDRIEGYNADYGNWTICHRFYVTAGMLPSEFNGLSDWGDGKGGREVDMGAATTLTDFINWGVTNYPAKRYVVILWNHGGGWKTLADEGKPVLPFKAVCWDNTSSGDALTTKEVRQAIESTGCYIHLIGFDACLMGMLEVATEISALGEVMVASEENEPTSGWNFTGFLDALKNLPSMSASQLGSSIVESYIGYGDKGATLAAIDLKKIEGFNEVLDTFVEKLLDFDNEWFNIYLARQSTQSFNDTEFIDLYDFLYNLSLTTSNPLVQKYLQDVVDLYSSLVINNYMADGYNAYGLSIYFPSYGQAIDSSYNIDVILFAGQTRWKDFLTAFVSADLFSNFTQVYGEDFSSGLPANWSVIDGYDDGKTWEVKYTQPRGFIASTFLSPPYMMVDSDAAGSVDMDEQLISPSYDFSQYSRVYLRFNHLFWAYTDEKGDVDIRFDGGTWQNLKRYEKRNYEGTVVIDISAVAGGRDHLQVRWHYYEANYDWFWAIDNVEFLVCVSEPLGVGDINSDGRIDISDVILCLRMAVGLNITVKGQEYTVPYTAELFELADLNEDRDVDISDVILTLRKSVGLN